MLRPYQQACVDAIYEHLRTRGDNPCAVLPTAAGKTWVLARICHDAVTLWSGRVLILAHVKELLEQAAEKLRIVCADIPVGVYSAGLKRRDTDEPIIVAGIQSVYRRAAELDRFDLIIIDEAHMIPPDGEGMYQQFLRDARVVNPDVRVIGLTATPFRLKDGPICAPANILNHVCHEVGVAELIDSGFLCPLVSKAGATKADTSSLHVRAGEFRGDEAEALMDRDDLVIPACQEIADLTANRNAVLIFATGVGHARHVAEVLQRRHGLEAGVVFGDTPTPERDAVLARFKAGGLKYMVNVNVLTTGFDAPHIDCVVLLRPTLSPGLYYQMVGRGFRLHPAKKDCLVLDYGGNVLRHGPVDQLRVAADDRGGEGEAPAKECPECRTLVAAGCSACPQCGYAFPPPERQGHEATASTAGVLSGQRTDTEHAVRSVFYAVHQKRGADASAPKTLRVEYEIGWHRFQKEWVCIEHDGYARAKAEAWWRARSQEPCPSTASDAVAIAQRGGLAEPTHITVRSTAGDDYDRIVSFRLKPKPTQREPGADEEEPAFASAWGQSVEDEVPF